MAFLIIFITLLSLIPSLKIPYVVDDVSFLCSLSSAQDEGHVLKWFFAAHNEHIMTFLKIFYYLFYNFFWLNAAPFHIVVLLNVAGICTLIYLLIKDLTGSKLTALFGLSLYAASQLCNAAFFVISESHISFSLSLLLLIFYSQLKFSQNGFKKWQITALISSLCAGSVVTLGLGSILFAFLFEKLCLTKESIKKHGSILKYILIGWIIATIPYFFAANKIAHADHYEHIGAKSVFDIIRVTETVKQLFLYFTFDFIPLFLPWKSVSVALFILAVIILIAQRKQINFRQLIFFAFFGIFITSLVYLFRVAFGVINLSYSRYDLYPTLMLSILYAIIFTPIIKKIDLTNKIYSIVFSVILIALVGYGGFLRYHHANLAALQTHDHIQKFYDEFEESITHYLDQKSPDQKLALWNRYMEFPKADSLKTKKGRDLDLSRGRYQLDLFAGYILPRKIRARIIWGEKTDPEFLMYLTGFFGQEKYKLIYVLLKNPR